MGIKVIKVQPESFASNSYILTNDGKTAVVIDPSDRCVLEVLEQNNLVCKYVLLTHGHFDHVGACGVLFEKGAQILCGEYEKGFIFSDKNLRIFGGVYIPHFEIAHTLSDNQQIMLCGIIFTAIATPGHTAGGMCYIVEDKLFSGDTLFRRNIGRTDLPTGDYKTLLKSLKKLFAISNDYKVYTGHGEDTTLDFERRYNPYAR